ncbi:MAG: gluconokinase [Acetobacter okinawensis]|uniref:gluconokinase n=1 Tax=Acetobacter okinawensis TaxID=1076594 RepID=UPI0039E9F65F
MPLNSSAFPPDHALPAQPAAHGITRQLVVVMGVCGSGKTTIAEGLHNELGWPWLDADTLHEPASIAKMRDGIPLTDADRSAWLERCHTWLRGCADRNTGGILACSALKHAYRNRLRAQGLAVQFVYLHADENTLHTRVEARTGHFMPSSQLPNQLETLEPPHPDEAAWSLSTLHQPAETIAQVMGLLKAKKS